MSDEHDPVSAPKHYTRLDPEQLDVAEAWGLCLHLGMVLKYISRAGHKGDALEDLRKAAEYLRRKIALLELARASEDVPEANRPDDFPARFAAVLKQYPRARPNIVLPDNIDCTGAVTVEPGDNPACTDRGNFAAAGQTGDCSTVPDDEECPWQSQACDSCKGYYGIGKSHS